VSEDTVRDGTNFYAYCGNNPVNYTDPSGCEDVPFSWSQGNYDVFGKISNIDTGSSWYNNIVDYTLCVPAEIFNLAASMGNVVTNSFGAVNEGIDFLDENVPSWCTPTGSVRSTIDGAFFVISVMAPEIAAWQQASAIAAQLKSASAAGNEAKLLWTSFENYPKVKVAGKEYAQIGGRLYTEHAVQRMLPSGLDSMGRSISPTYVDGILRTTKPVDVVVNGITRQVYASGSVQVVTENGIVVTVNPFRY
jgi:hypothetical protein